MKRFLWCIIVFSFNLLFSQGKRNIVFSEYEDSLKYFMTLMFNAPYDMERLKAHDEFRKYLVKTLQNEKVFEIAFDSIPVLYPLMSLDKSFMIVTYGFPLEDDAIYEIHGFMVLRGKPNRIIELQNVRKSIQDNPEYITLKNGQWYGAVYFQLIEKKYKKDKYYLLIGWNGEDPYYREKIIETLGFDSRGLPVFGKNYFRGKGYAKKKRIILRYSPTASVVARYQSITYKNIDVIRKEKGSSFRKKSAIDTRAQQGWKKKIKVKEITEELVVFDNLEPVSKEFEGFYSFYFPRDDRMNGLRFNKGKWEHVILTNVVVEKNTKKVNDGLVPPGWKFPWQ
jgi:hypothetical protein